MKGSGAGLLQQLHSGLSPLERSQGVARLLAVSDGCRAAIEVAENLGFGVSKPLVLQETNNTVVWLRPHPIVAKVATRADSSDGIVREHAVLSSLHRANAAVVAPVAGLSPRIHHDTGYVVTLWEHLEGLRGRQPSDSDVGRALGQLHAALSDCRVPLPSFREGLERARRALADDRLVSALAVADRRFLRSAFDEMVLALDERSFTEVALHGEPHDGNYLVTSKGLRWLDLEAACIGPLEWDLAFVGDDAVRAFTDVDPALLGLLRTLNSARVATWCWVRYQFPVMRWHANHHLAVVREGWTAGC